MDILTIRSELAEKVQHIPPIGKRLKFKLDEDVVHIDGSQGSNVISADDLDAECTIVMSKETYGKLQRKEIKPMIATLTGKVKVKGDLGLARKLKELM